MTEHYAVDRRDDRWVVTLAGTVVADFNSNAAAWRWVDRQQGQPISRSEHVAQWLADRA
jgi:hypothetical protein